MSFDQPTYSFQLSGEGPPTPTRTPTSPSFFNSIFETPKQDSKDQGLQSPWGNAFANALSPSFRTPNFATFGPLTPIAPRTSTGRDIEAEINHHELSSQATIPDSQPGGDLAGTLQPFDLADFDLTQSKPQDALKASIDTNVSSAGSMQTPPPTSTSTSRRKTQQAQVARMAREGRRMSSPSIQPGDCQIQRPSLEESPMAFPNLQFSPDGYSFPVSGPATAPVYPQQRIFWDTDPGSNTANFDMSVDDTFNAFGITSQKLQDPFSDDMNEMPTFTTSPSHNTLQQSVAFSQGHAPALNQTNMSSSTALMTRGSSYKNRGMIVNPSLLFSSPSRAVEDDQAPLDEIMQPYSQQIRDARLEREMKLKKQKRKRPPELGESPAVTAATEALRDASSNSSRSSPVVADSFFGALPEGPPQLESALPPRKRMTPDNNYQKHNIGLSRRRSSKKHNKHPSVSLKIDENGRAVTETSFVRNGLGNMDIGSDSDDDSDSPSERTFPSHLRSSQLRRSRFADDPYTHSQRSSDASTLASGRSASRLPGALSMNSGRAQVHFQSSQSSGVLDDSSEASTIVDSDEDRGDAQTELRKIVQQRSVKKKQDKPPAKNSQKQGKRLSFAPQTSKAKETPYYQTTTQATPTHYRYPEIPLSSPTTIPDPDLATPGSTYAGNSNASTTRCVCGSLDGKGGFMIQCESCRKWLHTACVGLSRNNVPDVYLCTFCTSTPRAVRGRGQHEPQRGMFPPPHPHQMANTGEGSPLGYKSANRGFR